MKNISPVLINNDHSCVFSVQGIVEMETEYGTLHIKVSTCTSRMLCSMVLDIVGGHMHEYRRVWNC